MSDVDTAQLAKDFADLKITLQELGVVANTYGKTAGFLEKQQGKLQARYRKNPFVIAGKQIKSLVRQTRLFNKVVVEKLTATKEEREETQKHQTALAKLITNMVITTTIGKNLAKTTGIMSSAWAKLTMKVFGLVSIFMIIGFSIAAVSIAFQGAATPLLEYTDGVWVLDEAVQGLILMLTGEGEGGLGGALNGIAAIMIITLPILILYGIKWAFLVGSIMAVVLVYQLVKKETGDTDVAMAAAAITVVALAGAFMMLKAAIALGTLNMAVLRTSFMFLAGGVIVAFALIAGGILGLFAFATGKVTGWKGWLLAVLSAVAITIGIIIIAGTSPFWIAAAIIIGVLAFVAAVVWKYRDKVMSGLTKAKDWILKWGEKTLKFFARIGYSLYAGVLYIVGLILALLAVVVGTILAVVGGIINAVVTLFTTFITAMSSGGEGFVSWFVNAPGRMVAAWVDGFKAIFNSVTGLYNDFAKHLKFTVPDWVPGIGGNKFEMPQFAMLAKGGIVNSPTLAMIGEDGPEAVVPLSKKNNPNGIGLGGGGNNITINVNASGITDRSDKRALAREIGEAIREEMSRGGRSHGGRRGAL